MAGKSHLFTTYLTPPSAKIPPIVKCPQEITNAFSNGCRLHNTGWGRAGRLCTNCRLGLIVVQSTLSIHLWIGDAINQQACMLQSQDHWIAIPKGGALSTWVIKVALNASKPKVCSFLSPTPKFTQSSKPLTDQLNISTKIKINFIDSGGSNLKCHRTFTWTLAAISVLIWIWVSINLNTATPLWPEGDP